MGKKMKLPFLSKSSPSWQWPSCGTLKTLSFRSTADMFKTVNPAYIDMAQYHVTTNGSCDSATCTKIDKRVGENEHQSQMLEPDSIIWLEGSFEEVVIGLGPNDRLFFNPETTSSILEEGKNDNVPFEECVAMVMDSSDPYVDFGKSMGEMVEAHGLRDWDNLEKLLNWYLMVNEKKNHGYVIGAFVDLLVGLGFSSLSLGCLKEENDDHHGGSCSSYNYIQDSLSSPLSFSFSTISSSPCLSSLQVLEVDVEKKVDCETYSQML